MRTRKTLAILGAGLILACCVMIYLMLDLTLFPQDHVAKLNVKNNQWLHFETRLAKLEEDLSKHHEALHALRESTSSRTSDDASSSSSRYKHRGDHNNKSPPSNTCQNFNISKVPEVDVQMLRLYKQLEFDNPDGGAWKQGWPIKYDEKQWHPTRKLRVFVVPHSHNDPGWLQTFEKYYTTQTQRILNNMVTKLAEDRRRKFIWAEISFFRMWWDEQSMATKDLVKNLIHEGQLEIVSGGWVMPDESVSHWMAQLTQLTEGHQWLKTNVDFVPTSGWAIDPFGLSPTMPFLLKNSGQENLLIQRVHYSVKKRLAKEKQLEFRWRQLWDHDGSTELFTHVMPFYSYDVPHTCGPDPKVCCQFDFFRLPNFGLTCPWRIAPRAISKSNVAERAALLLDQYRKKAQLYKTDVVLAPLGDDFRFAQSTEWDVQYQNYQKLFDYMNRNEQLNVQIQFGTLTDFFDAVRQKRTAKEFPTLSGDFFTYADRDDHYWSGYYTSRPFHKRLDRVLLGLLRGAELLAAVSWTKGNDQVAEGTMVSRISEARRWHALFQHHDGVTGTARDNVVIDYAQKMITALGHSAHLLQQSTAYLLKTTKQFGLDPEAQYFSMDEIRSHHTSPGDKHILSLGDDNTSRKVIIYNSLPRRRKKVQGILVSTPYVRVTDLMGQPVQCQVSPVWMGRGAMSGARYELSFLVSVPGFGITTYLVHALHGTTLPKETQMAKVTLYNSNILTAPKVAGFEHVQVQATGQEFSISQRADLSASFNRIGLLKALRVGNTTFPVHLEFVKYGTRGSGQDKSGAYLFLPDKPEPDILTSSDEEMVHLIVGPLFSRVFVELPYVKHICTLYNSPGVDGLGLHVLNEVDISETQNFELAMRLDTSIESGEHFYTDLNGLNIIKRQRFAKLPTQANYYPLAGVGYIEDRKARLTIATAQPLGATSMASGQFEIMQDRRLLEDDNRGLGQGVTDNLLTRHMFTIILEKRKPFCSYPTPPVEHPAGMLSTVGNLVYEDLLHPLHAMHPQNTIPFDLEAKFSPLKFEFPADMSVVSLRVFPIPEGAGKGVGLVLHRQAVDRCWPENGFYPSEDGELNLASFLESMEDWTISKAPLTFHNVGPSLTSPIVHLCPHQITPILFHKTQS